MTRRRNTPTRKVGAAGLGGALGVLVAAALGAFGVEPGAEVAAAITTVVAFVLGWVTPERAA